MYQQLYFHCKKQYNEYKLKFNIYSHIHSETEANSLSITLSLNPMNENAQYCLENDLRFNFETFLADCIEKNNNFFSIDSTTSDTDVNYLEITNTIIAQGRFGSIFRLEYEEKHYIIKRQDLDTPNEKIRACREILIHQYLSCTTCDNFFLKLEAFEFIKNTEDENYKLYMFFEKQTNDLKELRYILNVNLELKNQLDQFIINAIDYLHKINIVHYDIKPQNIVYNLIGDVYKFYLIDFGVAKISTKTISKSGTQGYKFPNLIIELLNQYRREDENVSTLVDYFSAIITILRNYIEIYQNGAIIKFFIKPELKSSRYQYLEFDLQMLFESILNCYVLHNYIDIHHSLKIDKNIILDLKKKSIILNYL